jgi:hypothetical protein
MDALPVRTMIPDEEGPAIAIMVLAFAADPVMRWAWPHIHQYMAAMPRFVRALGGGAFAHGTACSGDDRNRPASMSALLPKADKRA